MYFYFGHICGIYINLFFLFEILIKILNFPINNFNTLVLQIIIIIYSVVYVYIKKL